MPSYISKGYAFLVLHLMEFAKFQIKMARIKRRDLQWFCIFTWHLREFWTHTIFPRKVFVLVRDFLHCR
jgi:hypothetical protein